MTIRKPNAKFEIACPVAENVPHVSIPAASGSIRARQFKADFLQADLPKHEIDFAELEDGSLAEMIQDPANPENSLFAVYREGTVRYEKELHDRDRLLVPLSRTDEMSEVLFPTGAEPYGGLMDLYTDVGSFFRACLDVDDQSWVLMTAFVLSSWLPEKLPVAPYLAFVGPPGSGKTTALRILSLLCRRSLATSDLTSAGFYDVCHRLHPTVVIDETRTAGNQRTLLHLLRSSSTRGFVALRKDKARLAYGLKILSWVELPDDAALNSRCIVIPIGRTTRKDLVMAEDPRVLRGATEVRLRLLRFRFEHYRSLSLQKILPDVPLSGRPLDLFRALALPLAEEPEICKVLVHLIVRQQGFQRTLLSAAQESALRVLYRLIHDYPKWAGFSVGDITASMREDLASGGEPSQLKERKVGDVLTSLGLTDRSRANPGGYVLWLDREDRVRIHEKVLTYEIDGVSANPFPNCEICAEKKQAAASETSRPEPVTQKSAR